MRTEELTGLGWATGSADVRMEEITSSGWATRAANVRMKEITGYGWLLGRRTCAWRK
ncbi:hypothetical protein [Cohnella faecalis]|uniref:hypothetical protein n=1 Tax=Cohnella faecalis TaxID=2315694 RepID=UPI00131425F6|nr:hypothetical protein [Cohnella faecalis]